MFLWARRCFDGRAAGDDVLVEVAGSRIATVERCHRDSVPEDAVVYDDATLLPGLVDAHQHLVFDASADAVGALIASEDEPLAEHIEHAGRRALAAGITTIRDLGDRAYITLDLRDRIAAGGIGPTIVAAGPPITITRGHCWFMGGEADGPAGVRRAVREHVARGVDVIKMMVTGGNMTPTVGPHESQYGPAEVTALVDEAHRLGKRVAAHAHGYQGIVDALRAGVDTLEHCTFMTADGIDSRAGEVIEEIARRGTVVSCTWGVLPDVPRIPAIAARVEALTANSKRMVAAGVTVVAGTDGGVSPGKPHDVLPYAISPHMEVVGMTPQQALTAVTSLAAAVCGVGDRKGVVEPGRDADLVVVGGDVTADLSRIHDVRAVYAAGRLVTS